MFFLQKIRNYFYYKNKNITFLSFGIYVLKYFFLILFAFFLTLPFLLMISYALKDNSELTSVNFNFFPKKINLDSFRFILNSDQKEIPFLKYFFNTFIMVFWSTLIGTFISIITAFAFSVLNFKFKKTIFRLFFLSMMIINETLILVNFRTVSFFKMVSVGNSYVIPFGVYFAMILPFLVDVFHIFLLLENSKKIPKELYYAAKIDGANDLNYLFKIWIPILKPTIFTIFILRSVAAWNAYLWPELVGGKLLTNMMTKMFTYDFSLLKTNSQMAAAFLIILPLILVFLFFKKYIIQGELRSGIKG